jgi:GNAT superfamily N-acetyltransferase
MLDFYEQTATAKIYEIFVLNRFRQLQVGSSLLKYAEARAREFGATLLQLDVHPLEESIDSTRLRDWYSSEGFDRKSGASLMIKLLMGRMKE